MYVSTAVLFSAQSIKRDNVAHFLSANFLSLPLESASARRREEIEESIDLIEQVTGYTFPAGKFTAC
jgi:hypothetical protein